MLLCGGLFTRNQKSGRRFLLLMLAIILVAYTIIVGTSDSLKYNNRWAKKVGRRLRVDNVSSNGTSDVEIDECQDPSLTHDISVKVTVLRELVKACASASALDAVMRVAKFCHQFRKSRRYLLSGAMGFLLGAFVGFFFYFFKPCYPFFMYGGTALCGVVVSVAAMCFASCPTQPSPMEMVSLARRKVFVISQTVAKIHSSRWVTRGAGLCCCCGFACVIVFALHFGLGNTPDPEVQHVSYCLERMSCKFYNGTCPLEKKLHPKPWNIACDEQCTEERCCEPKNANTTLTWPEVRYIKYCIFDAEPGRKIQNMSRSMTTREAATRYCSRELDTCNALKITISETHTSETPVTATFYSINLTNTSAIQSREQVDTGAETKATCATYYNCPIGYVVKNFGSTSLSDGNCCQASTTTTSRTDLVVNDVFGRVYGNPIIFVIDESGSMGAVTGRTRRTVCRKELENVLKNLTETTKINVIPFSKDAHLAFPSPVPATSEHVNKAMKKVRAFSRGTSTNSEAALELAYNMTTSSADDPQIYFLSDGVPNQNVSTILDRISGWDYGRNIKVNTIFVGSGDKGEKKARDFMHGLATKTGGTFKEIIG